MKVFTLAAAAAALASTVSAQACPTVTAEAIAPQCSKSCNNQNCMLVSTVMNPCGCPMAIPTATLLSPCDAACPWGGCSVQYRTMNEACAPSTSTRASTTTSGRSLTWWPPRPTWSMPSPSTPSPSPTSSTTTVTPRVITSITTLAPPSPTAAACPTVIVTTRPSNCPALRCPVPNCSFQETLALPCGCSAPMTALYVAGCQESCPTGCMTRTDTIREVCPRTALPA